jgi:hypothetical protein
VPISVLQTAPKRGLDLSVALRHLLGISSFAEPVAAGDRRWHSWVGTELTSLAFEPGYPRVITRDRKVLLGPPGSGGGAGGPGSQVRGEVRPPERLPDPGDGAGRSVVIVV